MTTDLYREWPGRKELNEGVVVEPGRFGPSRKEEFADVCEGCGRFWQRIAMGIQSIFAVCSSAEPELAAPGWR